MKKTKTGSRQKRVGCREASREFSFLCVLCGPVLMSGKSVSKRSAQ